MKKCILVLIATLFLNFGFSQSLEEKKVEQTIVDFFEAFHKQDTLKLKAIARGNIHMQSISLSKEGEVRFNESNYNDFIKNIAAIPKTRVFKEEILGFEIKIDGNMANAWTPYEFYLNGNFSHCGVNSFQLFKEKNNWKIIYLVDTRNRKGCKK